MINRPSYAQRTLDLTRRSLQLLPPVPPTAEQVGATDGADIAMSIDGARGRRVRRAAVLARPRSLASQGGTDRPHPHVADGGEAACSMSSPVAHQHGRCATVRVLWQPDSSWRCEMSWRREPAAPRRAAHRWWVARPSWQLWSRASTSAVGPTAVASSWCTASRGAAPLASPSNCMPSSNDDSSTTCGGWAAAPAASHSRTSRWPDCCAPSRAARRSGSPMPWPSPAHAASMPTRPASRCSPASPIGCARRRPTRHSSPSSTTSTVPTPRRCACSPACRRWSTIFPWCSCSPDGGPTPRRGARCPTAARRGGTPSPMSRWS